MAVTLFNDEKALNRLIGSIAKTSKSFALNIHTAAYNCLVLCENTGDIRPMQKLYNVLPNAERLALRVWATKHGKFRFNNAKEAFGSAKNAVSDLPGAEETGPLAYRPTPKARTRREFNLKAELQKLAARAVKHECSGKAVSLLEQAVVAA